MKETNKSGIMTLFSSGCLGDCSVRQFSLEGMEDASRPDKTSVLMAGLIVAVLLRDGLGFANGLVEAVS